MIDKQARILSAQPMPLGWFMQWAAYIVAGVGYLFGLFVVQRSWAGFLLLTAIYGAWLVAFHLGRMRSPVPWLLALFGLACASLFIPLPGRNSDWLPILPTMTACLLIASRPRSLGLLLATLLWLSTSVALRLISQTWDMGGQVVLLMTFVSTCACTLTISELAAAHRQLREYSAEIEELSVIRERNRIARDIHDTLGHALTLLAVQLETATQHETRGDPRLHEELLEARQVVRDCLRDVRHSVEALRPDKAAAGSLLERLRKLADDFAATSHETRIELDFDEATHPLTPEQAQTLYRCAQEALTNIRKHAHASRVLVRLSTNDAQVELTVLDDGHENSSQHEHSLPGFGLLGMRERVALLQGTLRTGPEPRHGWRVEAVLPLTPSQQVAGRVSTHRRRRQE